jgi:hypothetical protein
VTPRPNADELFRHNLGFPATTRSAGFDIETTLPSHHGNGMDGVPPPVDWQARRHG